MPSRVLFLAGRIDSGKTAFVRDLIRGLQERKISVGGVLSPARKIGGRKTRYFVEDIRSGHRRFLLEKTPKGPLAGPQGFPFGNRALRRAAACAVAVVDEFGPIELAGKGFFKKARTLIGRKDLTVLIVVRKGLVTDARRSLGLRNVKVFDLDRESGRNGVLKRLGCQD